MKNKGKKEIYTLFGNKPFDFSKLDENHWRRIVPGGVSQVIVYYGTEESIIGIDYEPMNEVDRARVNSHKPTGEGITKLVSSLKEAAASKTLERV